MEFERNYFHLEMGIVASIEAVSVAYPAVVLVVDFVAALEEVLEQVFLVLSWRSDCHRVIVVDSRAMRHPSVRHDDKVYSDPMMNSIFE